MSDTKKYGYFATAQDTQGERLRKITSIIREAFPSSSDLQDHRALAQFLGSPAFELMATYAHLWRRYEGIEPFPAAKEPETSPSDGWLRSYGRYGDFSIRISTISSLSEGREGQVLIRTSDGNFYSDERLSMLEAKLKKG